jgi:sugar/nucleoside kinase (ribokinase family)
MTPNLLIAGHIVKDVTADGWRPGGGVLYAASQARRLGVGVAIATACAPDLDPAALLPEVDWHVSPSEVTTTFENVYENGIRRQRLLARGQSIRLDSVPHDWLKAPMLLLTPLFHEIEPSAVAQLASQGRTLGIEPQGWLRALDGDCVRPTSFDPSPPWLAGDVIFVSDEDIAEAEAVAAWQERVPIVVLTRGRGGCTVWDVAGRHEVSAPVVPEMDPTGAGDVFAAAFLVRYHETRDALTAASFASAAGALSVRASGFEAVASRKEIEGLLSLGQVKVA